MLNRYKTTMINPIGVIMSLPAFVFPTIVLPSIEISDLTTAQKACILLGFFFVLDFITGILASWVEFKKVLPLVPSSGKRYVISSTKLRLSGVKFITYAFGIICAWGIEVVFVLREIPTGKITTHDLTFTTIVIAFFCAIEFYSIFFENIKRMGFDIIHKVKTIVKSGWNLYKDVKDENKD